MPPTDASRPTLLAVDDEEAIRQIVARFAEEAGFEAKMVGDSRELSIILETSVPAVIVLDLNMEGKDGIEILGDFARRKLPSKIIIFSGSDTRVLETAQQLAERQGLVVAATLQKPVRRAALLEVLNRVKLEHQPFDAQTLRHCLDHGLLQLQFQPKLSLATFEISGCEALLRCCDVAGRTMPPEQIINVAEHANMIDEVSIWVFRAALDEARRWREAGLNLSVAVNLSAQSATNAELPALFSAICAENNYPHNCVTIELTESAAMDEALVSHETLLRLRVKGFHLSVDDFGTGYSSLLRLRRLPFSELKTDKSFVMNMHRSKDDAAIVAAVITLASQLSLRCVIEGAETQQSIDYAASLGCGEAQGYFISQPVAANEIPSFIKTWRWRKNSLPWRMVESKSESTEATVVSGDHGSQE